MIKKIKVFLIVSSLERSGPSLGAVAMLRLLEKFPEKYDVNLISRFKKDKNFILDEKNIIYTKNYFKTFLFLIKNKNIKNIFCLSYDLKMDFINVITRKKKYIYVRGNLLDNFSVSFGKFLGTILNSFQNFLLHNCSGILVLTETQKNIYRKSNPNFLNKINVLPNFIDEIPKMIISKKKNSFLIIGSFITRKRVYETLNAFITVFCDDENYSLTIIGKGPLDSKIKKLIRDDFKCSIKIINESVNPLKFLQESEYFILMSDSEGLSRASLEASYFNCKLILSDIDVHNEFFSDYGLIVKSFDELVAKFRLISEGKILLKPGFPNRCNSISIEKKFNLIVNQYLSK